MASFSDIIMGRILQDIRDGDVPVECGGQNTVVLIGFCRVRGGGGVGETQN